MILAAHQPQFMPWLGYFDKMLRCDLFVVLDDVQYKKNEWQNRNKIWSREGGQWLTVPVLREFPSEIREVRVNEDTHWRHKHLQTLTQTYSKARCFGAEWEPWREMYERGDASLLDVNMATIELLRARLEVRTPLKFSSGLGVDGKATQRLVDLCRKLGADAYLAGAGGKDYMDMGLFERAGIKVVFQAYAHPEYFQFGGPFVSHLSAFDLICHHGPDAAKILRSTR